MTSRCTTPACARTPHARGLCFPCYKRAWRLQTMSFASRRGPRRFDHFRASGGACLVAPGPCARTHCRHHLAHDHKYATAQIAEPCGLKLADGGPMSLLEVGRVLGLTRERVRQIEADALRKLGGTIEARGFGVEGRRRRKLVAPAERADDGRP